jgi:hypothetical protein
MAKEIEVQICPPGMALGAIESFWTDIDLLPTLGRKNENQPTENNNERPAK